MIIIMIAVIIGIAVAMGTIMAVIVIPLSQPQLRSCELQAVSVLVLVRFRVWCGFVQQGAPIEKLVSETARSIVRQPATQRDIDIEVKSVALKVCRILVQS
jgi:hypothetical protein